MDFSLSDHQKLIRDTLRQFMENEVRPGVRQRDRERRLTSTELTARLRALDAVASGRLRPTLAAPANLRPCKGRPPLALT